MREAGNVLGSNPGAGGRCPGSVPSAPEWGTDGSLSDGWRHSDRAHITLTKHLAPRPSRGHSVCASRWLWLQENMPLAGPLPYPVLSKGCEGGRGSLQPPNQGSRRRWGRAGRAQLRGTGCSVVPDLRCQGR